MATKGITQESVEIEKEKEKGEGEKRKTERNREKEKEREREGKRSLNGTKMTNEGRKLYQNFRSAYAHQSLGAREL